MHKVNSSYEFTEEVLLRTPYLSNNIDKDNREHVLDEKILEALYLASPVLVEQLMQNREQSDGKLWISFYKYLSRMSSRCTPFGLFAGISMMSWGTHVPIKVAENIQRKTRLDMAYLCKLADDISKNRAVRHKVKYFANNTLYQAGDQLRYIELQYFNANRRYQISSAPRTEYLDGIIYLASTGTDLKTLADFLVSDDISYDEAYEYLFELIDNRLLIWEMDPKVTNEKDYGQSLHHFLSQHAELLKEDRLKEINDTLAEVLNAIDRLDGNVSGNIDRYKAIFNQLKGLGVPVQENNLFQVDYTRSVLKGKLDENLQQDLFGAMEALRYLNYRLKENLLNTFKEKFYAKYEDREVPLQTVLDTDIGLVYGSDTHSDTSPLIDDISVGGMSSGVKKIIWYDENAFLLKALTQCFTAGEREIILKKEDFEGRLQMINTEEMPDSMAAIFRTLGGDQRRVLLEYFSGSSAVNVLGRFAHIDTQTHHIIDKIIEKEEMLLKPGEVMAEIVHFPEDRIGNIILRPSFIKHEIPYLTLPGVEQKNTIQMEDLMLSMKNGKFLLRSSRTGLIIKPRLSNAHNFSNKSLPVYRFLCDLQAQDRVGGLSFDWTPFFTTQFDFLPRVSYGSVVLCPAMWMLRSVNLAKLKKEFVNITEFQNYFLERTIPLKFVISEGDNELIIDLTAEIGLSTFKDYIKRRESVTIKELFDEGKEVVNVQGLPFNAQFIAPLFKKTENVSPQKQVKKIDLIEQMADFQPGDSWLYYKVYCGTQSADKLLIENIRYLSRRLYESDLIDKSFFIRFSDPEWHLRLRFHVKDPERIGEIIDTVKEEFGPKIRSGIISKIQIDTYKPEFKRYGSNSIKCSESIFEADSLFVTGILAELEDYDDPEELRWLIALSSIDALLDDFLYDLEDKIRIMSSISGAFNKEFQFNKSLKIQMDSKYRKYRSKITSVLESTPGNLLNLHEMVERRSKTIKPLALEIMALEKQGKLKVEKDDLLASYIHMHINRLMKSKQRLNELLLYYFLDKYYASAKALRKKSLSLV